MTGLIKKVRNDIYFRLDVLKNPKLRLDHQKKMLVEKYFHKIQHDKTIRGKWNLCRIDAMEKNLSFMEYHNKDGTYWDHLTKSDPILKQSIRINLEPENIGPVRIYKNTNPILHLSYLFFNEEKNIKKSKESKE